MSGRQTASFLGQICIPLGLILLGASFARLELPKPLWRLPIAAIVVSRSVSFCRTGIDVYLSSNIRL